MSGALTPADRMEVAEVAVAPNIKLVRPAVIMDLQVNTPGYVTTHCDATQSGRQRDS